MNTTEVLLNFFKNIPHNCARIAGWYNPAMEVQINVLPLNGEAESPGVYSDSKQPYKWYNVRIPKNAKTNPIDNDFELSYPLDVYVDAIGMTGWDWRNKQSVRFGFDYDAMVGHASGVGITDEALARVKEKAHEIPEVLILRSSGGAGLHLYIECDPEHLPTTATHTEHAALALAALADLSEKVGFDFHAQMDVGGGNMWVWARKMTPENRGLTIEKNNVDSNGNHAYYTPRENWREYIDVARGKRQTPRLRGVSDEDQELIDQQKISQDKVHLTAEHKRVIEDLHEHCPDATTAWIPENGLLQTHTCAIKRIFDRGNYKGLFNTISEGRDLSKPNCFAYPQPDGGWKVHRFGKGTNETPEWSSSKDGWTRCFFNSIVSLNIASQSKGAEDSDGGFVFNTQEDAIKAAMALGNEIIIPEELQARKTKLLTRPDGRLMVEIVTLSAKDKDLEITGWIKKRGQWTKLFGDVDNFTSAANVDLEVLDNIIRSLVTPDHGTAGWTFKHTDGAWITTQKDDARTAIAATPYAKTSASALAIALTNSWTLVNLPFQPIYPGGRKWNLDGAQLKMKPANLEADEIPQHPHWDLVLKHCTQALNEGLKLHPWAIDNNILTGYDYMMCWIASVFKHPFEPLPYMFFHGDQGSGKSILHEGLEKLMTKGVVRADHALTSKEGFNGELDGAIICVVEEKSISKYPEAYARLKDWVTAVTFGIHAKFKTVYSQKNSTHWLHMANEIDGCPVFEGDSRIISMEVPAYTNEEIPKEELLNFLEEEAPHFLVSINRLDLPEIYGRLRLPIIMTESRAVQEVVNRNPLEVYLAEKCFYAPGEFVFQDKFVNKFINSLSDTDRGSWQMYKVLSGLKPCYPVGKLGSDNVIGNLSYKAPKEEKPTQRYSLAGTDLILTNI